MLEHPTIDQLRALKLDGMADAFVELQAQDRSRDLAPAEWLALLLDREASNRGTKRFQTRLRSAHLRHGQDSIEDVDYRTAPSPGDCDARRSSGWSRVAGTEPCRVCAAIDNQRPRSTLGRGAAWRCEAGS